MKRTTQIGVLLLALGSAWPAYSAQVINEGRTITGRLEPGDAKHKGYWADTYNYAAEAAEELWIYTNNSKVHMRVEGPGGFWAENADNTMSVRLPKGGRYKIMVKASYYDTREDYQLGVARVITTQGPATFRAGETLQGGFSMTDGANPDIPHLRQEALTYTAQAGEAARFHFDGQQSYLVVEVLGVKPHKKYETADAGQAGDFPVYFAEAGDYQVLISGDGGNYSIASQPRQAASAAPAIGHVAFGQTIQLAYAPESPIGGETQSAVSIHTFDAQAGDKLSVVRPSNTNASIRGPDGQLVPVERTQVAAGYEYLSQATFTAPATGRYRIEAPVWASMPAKEATLQLIAGEQGVSMVAERRAQKEARIQAAVERGNQLLNSGASQEAAAAFREALNLDGSSVAALIGEGVAKYRLGEYFIAAYDFESALIYEPGNQLAAGNLAAAKQAEQAKQQQEQYQQQQQQLAYQEQQRRQAEENAAVWSNALGAFATGVGLGVAMNEAAAVAAAPPPAPAPEPAWPAASAPAQYASSGIQPSPDAPSGGPRIGKVSFLNPDTGRQCVTPGRTYTEARDDGGFNYYWVFTNTCNTQFRVFTYMNTVEPGYPPEQSAGIQPGSTARPTELKMICIFSKYNLRQSCKGYNRYEVRYP